MPCAWSYSKSPQFSTRAIIPSACGLTRIKNNNPLFGQGLNLIRAETPATLYVEWMKQHPDAPFIRYLGFLNTEVLVPNSLAAHKNVLYDNCYTFAKPQWFLRIVKEVAGHGLILMEGAEHRAHRRMLTNSFSLKSIRKLEPVFKEKAQDICRFFDQRISNHDGKTGTFDCIDTFMRAILDIMGTVILGVDLDYVKPGTGGEASQSLNTGNSGKAKRECSFHEAYDVFFAPDTMGKILLFANAHVPLRWLPFEANRKFLFAMDWLNGKHRYSPLYGSFFLCVAKYSRMHHVRLRGAAGD